MDKSLRDLPDETLVALAPTARLAVLGSLTADVVHAANNALFAVLAHVELVLAEAEPESPRAERLRLVQETGLDLKAILRGLGGLVRSEDAPGPTVLDESVRAVADLLRRTRRHREVAERYPEEPLAVAAGRDDVRQLVAQVLVHAAAVAGGDGTLDVEVVREGGFGVLRARAEGRAGAESESLGVLAARALAKRHGGSLELGGPGELRLALPLA